MTIRMSTGLRNALLEKKPVKDLFADGFMKIFNGTQPSSADNDESSATKLMVVCRRVTNVSYIDESSFKITGEDATDYFSDGKTVKADCGDDGIVTSKVASSSYDDSDTTVTLEDDVLTSNLKEVLKGCNFGGADSGSISKASGEIWQGKGEDDGTAGWFRLYTNDEDEGEDDGTKVRFDGSCGSSGDLQMVSTAIQKGATSTIDQFILSIPS